MKSKLKKWVAMIGLMAFCLLAISGAVGAAARPMPAGVSTGPRLEGRQENSTSKPNDPGNSAVVDGGFFSKAKAWAKDHVVGLLYGLGVGLVVGLAVAGIAVLLVASAPVWVIVGVGALAGAAYGLFTGAIKFDVWDCVLFSAIAAASAGFGTTLAAGWVGKAALESVGGGLAMVGSYLMHDPHPTWGGAGQAFGIGVLTSLAFIGLGAGVNKLFGPSLAKAGTWLRNLLPWGRGAGAAAGEAAEAGLTAGGSAGGEATAVGGAAGRGSGAVLEGAGPASGSALETEAAVTAEGAVLERVGTAEAGATLPTAKPTPGTALHKELRWQEYQQNGGAWTFERWSKQYDTNMRNATYGLAREDEYRTAFGGDSKVLRVPRPDGTIGKRQVDIYRDKDLYAGQLKTGRQNLSPENIEAIRRDLFLVRQGLQVEWILEKGASQQLLDALKEAGIDVHIGPMIP